MKNARTIVTSWCKYGNSFCNYRQINTRQTLFIRTLRKLCNTSRAQKTPVLTVMKLGRWEKETMRDILVQSFQHFFSQSDFDYRLFFRHVSLSVIASQCNGLKQIVYPEPVYRRLPLDDNLPSNQWQYLQRFCHLYRASTRERFRVFVSQSTSNCRDKEVVYNTAEMLYLDRR